MKKMIKLWVLLILVGTLLLNGCEKDDTSSKNDPVISWENPADIVVGTLLSEVQLNATANALGTFVYTPALGAKLNEGANQDLKVIFTPSDAVTYNTVSKTVKINVINVMPNSIIGKRLLFNLSYDVSGFTSSGTCTVPSGLIYGMTYTITKSPTYTYKVNNSNALFTCKYSYKETMFSFYTNFDVTYNLTLTFLTTTSGTLTGTVNFIKTSGDLDSMYFTFTDQPFTLE